MSADDELLLLSPMDGWAAGLEETEDPVFAQKMLGDGVAIDPTSGVLRAPAAATVTSVHAARHAVGLRTRAGPEILLHIGIETVGLRGEGFEAHVAPGQAVSAGDPLITFDLDRTALGARSLVSPLVVTDGGGFEIVERRPGGLVAVGDVLLRLRRVGTAQAASSEAAGPEASRSVVIPLAHGLHARPAARVAALAQGHQARIEVSCAGRKADARSPVGLMALGLGRGDTATLHAVGPDAEAAVRAIAELIEGGMGEAGAPESTPVPGAAPAPPAAGPADGRLRGVAASPGLAIGAAARLASGDIAVAETGGAVEDERRALTAALAAVSARIAEAAGRETDPTRRSILAAHESFLSDPTLASEAERLLADGKSAGYAWKSAVGGFIEVLQGLADPRLAERVDDLRDLERRVLSVLAGDEAADADVPAGAILLADELLPSQLMAIPAGRLAGIATAGGGPTSHVAILAAAMNIPALVAIGPGLAAVQDGTPLIVDADAGALEVAPNAKALAAAQARLAERRARHEAATAAALAPAQMADGALVSVLANLGAREDAQRAVAAGADGSGLLRTEFLFLDREEPPSEDEQAQAYRDIAAALGARPLTIRLLDIGGDKPAAYLPAEPEENPALGVRGVRLLLRRPDLLRAQLRAILRAGSPDVSIMIPMVSSLAELAAVREALEGVCAELGGASPPPLGVMIETPAAAMVADQLAATADFLSIGTNDLTQYALAIDRGHPALAGQVDGLDPAVLRLVKAASDGAAAAGRPISVCGGLAGDPAAIPIMIGLGVSKLSMPAAAIAEAKALVRGLTLEACRGLAQAALAAASAKDVRALANAAALRGKG